MPLILAFWAGCYSEGALAKQGLSLRELMGPSAPVGLPPLQPPSRSPDGE